MMSKFFLKKNIFYILGFINFSDINYILYEYSEFSKNNYSKIIVNLRYLSTSNTSMLLLMINFIKLCIKRNQTIKFVNVPIFLIELGRVYNLNNILYDFNFRGYHVKRKN